MFFTNIALAANPFDICGLADCLYGETNGFLPHLHKPDTVSVSKYSSAQNRQHFIRPQTPYAAQRAALDVACPII
ncbi:MAG: hypothetical protein ABF544_05440 [Acetobacter orientalis]|uniref:hypothetical protein n=1 Tax=Acetobacter orientalis TaxID=146474 RepID=UPI0039ED374B